MSSIGTGYDLVASTFSPDGRIFQVEYAQKAVDSAGTALGLRGADAVVVAVERALPSALIDGSANPRMANVDSHVGFCATGCYPDTRSLLHQCVDEAQDYRRDLRAPVPIARLADRVSSYMHAYTLGIHRPFGCAAFLSSWSADEGGRLFVVEPSGQAYEYYAWAVGKNRQAAKAEIEKLSLSSLGADALVAEAVRIVLTVRDEPKSKRMQLELGVVGASTGGRFSKVSAADIAAAEERARVGMDDDDSDDDMQH